MLIAQMVRVLHRFREVLEVWGSMRSTPGRAFERINLPQPSWVPWQVGKFPDLLCPPCSVASRRQRIHAHYPS
jgi:hypothetical protein